MTISVAKDHVSKRTWWTESLTWLADIDFVPYLRYLEFRGVYLSPPHRPFLETLTMYRTRPDIIFEYDGQVAFIRDDGKIPLSQVPMRTAEDDANEKDEHAWEDEEEKRAKIEHAKAQARKRDVEIRMANPACLKPPSEP